MSRCMYAKLGVFLMSFANSNPAATVQHKAKGTGNEEERSMSKHSMLRHSMLRHAPE